MNQSVINWDTMRFGNGVGNPNQSGEPWVWERETEDEMLILRMGGRALERVTSWEDGVKSPT